MTSLVKPYSRRKAPSEYSSGYFDQEFQYLQQSINSDKSAIDELLYGVDLVKLYGAANDLSADISGAVNAAIADLPVYGGKIVLQPGRYLWSKEVVSTKPLIIESWGPSLGPTFTPNSNEKGSYVMLGANISGSMLRFAIPSSGIVGWGSGIRYVTFFGNFRAFTCDAAVHVQSASLFNLHAVNFEQVKGRALRVSNTIKSDFNLSNISQCGDTGKPALDLDPAGTDFVQGSSFTQFKIETCYADYFSASANVQTNKFDDFGFEADPAQPTTLNRFMLLAGQRNQIGKMHFNRSDATSAFAKAEVTGTHNEFSNLLFAGQRSATALGGDMIVSGNFNQFGLIKAWGQLGLTEAYKTIHVSGAGNTIDELKATFDGGFTLAGDYNTLTEFSSFSGKGQYLISGLYCDAPMMKIQGSTYNGDLVVISGAHSDAKVRVITAASATSAVKITSSGKLLPGSFLQNITNGHAVWFTNNLGSADGVIVNICGKHGFFVDECEPRRIANCEVWDAGALTPSTYDAYSFNSTTTRSTGGVLSGNTAHQSTSTHRHAFFSTDNAGTPRFQNWVITSNNHAAGGDFSWSTGTNIIANNRS